MGVQGLWNLLSPVGRRVNVETLAGKRLAIDASIWMIQFMKAMRDERGEMVRNAHLLGFFRRICKLLFLRTKPVFVFDGGTPFLKRRTVIARRRQREDAQYNLRKTAEKLLLNQLKKTRLKELAKELEEQKRMKNQEKGKKVAESDVGSPDRNGARAAGLNQEELDAMLAASLAAEEHDTHNTGASASSYAFHGQDGGASASSYAFHGQDGGATTSAFANSVDDVEDEDEDDEEMILPITNGNIDPAVLAALPPSMQLDLLVQMRERLMAENRQKYQKVKKDPQEFSELQIETYLKTVAFRREIDEVQKAASGKGVGGLQTARIASEGNKEFIFSSSFTGDKHVLASAGMKKTVENQDGAEVVHSFTQPTTLDSAVASSGVSVRSSDVAPTSSGNDSRKDFGSDVQTYHDERGLMRVSRVRAMDIRMTRDLQRNLDLMKEMEQDTTSGASVPLNVPVNHAEKDVGNNKQISENFSEISGEISSKTTETHEKYRPTTTIETSFEISFEDDAQCMPVDNDDDFFASLVAGDPDPINSVDESDSDCEWEEDTIGIQIENVKLAAKTSQLEERNDDETELQWEGGLSNNPEDATLCPAKSVQTKSRGSIEEEAALQEAIRISLEGSKGEMDASCNLKRDNKVIHLMSEAPPDQDNVIGAPKKCSSDSSPDMIQMESADDACQNIDMVVGIPSENFVRSDVGCLTECGMNILGETAKAQSNTTVGTPEKSYNPLSDVPCESPCSTLHSHVADITLADPLNLTCQKISQTDEAVPPIRHSKEAPDVAINMEKSEEPIPDAGINRTVREAEPNHGFDEREHNFVGRDNEDDNIQVAGARLEDEIQQLDEEYAYLEDEHKKSERNADCVSSEMYVECQELLQMFGIPYVIAPMEAEAQCAYMELAGLVEGVVTDDSDVFLFGARSVYKNIFDDRKYVETYLMKDMENELGLTREKLIRIALLLGSDYTEGVSGIGIVNAIEVVNAFPEENGLSKFREWVESPDPTILGLSRMTPGSSSKKKRSKSSDISMDASNVTSSNCDDHEKAKDTHELENVPKITQIFMKKHRNVSKNWHIPSSFPSEAVISAYASPQVDKSADPCSWGEPDLSALRRLCLEKFGWASQKAEELLLPVLKEYNKRETQLRMEAFYTFNERFAKIRSKRIKQAVKGITGNQSLESTNDPKVGSKRNKRKKPTKNDTVCGEESVDNIAKESKKSKTRRESFSSKKEKTSESVLEKEAGSRGDAGATTKGKQKTQAGGRRKRKGTTDVGRSDADSSDDEEELQLQKAEAPDRLRRSTRSRKSAKYAESDEEVDLTTQSMCDATEEEKLRDQDFDNDDSVCHSEMGQLTARDSVLDDGLCGDHLLKGGGFCADEDEPENETGTVQDDSAPVEVDRHYLQMGGGFCVDEDEPESETETLQDISAPVDVDRHYLQMGGGFCFDDRDSDHDSQNRTSEETEVTLKEIEENASQMCSSTPSQGALGSAAGIQSSNPSGLQQQQQDHNDTASGSASQPGKAISEVKEDTNSRMKALSAMPYLRRRRKKSF